MTQVTYYVALPFMLTEEDELRAGEAQECQTATQAERRARSLAEKHAGAVAFARSGDPMIGDFQPAEILASFGKVPSVDKLMGY